MSSRALRLALAFVFAAGCGLSAYDHAGAADEQAFDAGRVRDGGDAGDVADAGDAGGSDAGESDGGEGDAGDSDAGEADAGCVPSACGAPPDPVCASATSRRTFGDPHCGEDGGCEFASVVEACDAPPAGSCVGGTATVFESAGRCEAGACRYTSRELACGSVGCCGDRCCAVVPSNGFGDVGDTALDVTTPANGIFDTDRDCAAMSALGTCSVARTGDTNVCVCRSSSLRVPGTLKVVGTRALALLVRGTVRVEGTLDASSSGISWGPGAWRDWESDAAGLAGGAGGSFGSKGGNTGALATYGSPALVPLEAGMPGQPGCSQAWGGGGGGAVQITAGEEILVEGVVTAGGGGGPGGDKDGQCLGGSGGGSGGAILLEAPAVVVTGGIFANGGGGGGGGANDHARGGAGTDGKPQITRVPGGEGEDGHGCALGPTTSGGDGGAGSAGNESGAAGMPSDSVTCLGGTHHVGGGGGGGGAGRIRVNTKTGCSCAGEFSPPPSFGAVAVE